MRLWLFPKNIAELKELTQELIECVPAIKWFGGMVFYSMILFKIRDVALIVPPLIAAGLASYALPLFFREGMGGRTYNNDRHAKAVKTFVLWICILAAFALLLALTSTIPTLVEGKAGISAIWALPGDWFGALVFLAPFLLGGCISSFMARQPGTAIRLWNTATAGLALGGMVGLVIGTGPLIPPSASPDAPLTPEQLAAGWHVIYIGMVVGVAGMGLAEVLGRIGKRLLPRSSSNAVTT